MGAKAGVITLGIVFIGLGIVGFYDDPIAGIFEVDIIHNLIHLFSGILAIIFGVLGTPAARWFAKVFGIIYALLGVIGLFVPGEMLFSLIEANLADDILHIVLGVIFLYVGFGISK